MSGILLGVPKRAEINVGRDMINSRLDGQNLHDSDVTTIHVAGDIINRNEFTTVNVLSRPNFSVFDLLYPPLQGAVAGVQNLFTYNATTGELTFRGRMTGDQLQALLNLRSHVDQNGFPILDRDGEPRRGRRVRRRGCAQSTLREQPDVPPIPTPAIARRRRRV
jgi:hypothetical protein